MQHKRRLFQTSILFGLLTILCLFSKGILALTNFLLPQEGHVGHTPPPPPLSKLLDLPLDLIFLRLDFDCVS